MRVDRLLRNWVAQLKIRTLDESNLYQLGYARSFHTHVLQNNASLVEAAASLRRALEGMIRDGHYNYDLEVLEKSGPSIKVRDALGREMTLLDLVTNSYNDLDMIEETRTDLGRYVRDRPISSCLSRKIAGRYTVHRELEEEIADFLGYETAILGTSGYISQISTLFSLFRRGDVIFSDQHNHSSLIDGCQLSKAKVIVYRHLDYDDLATQLRRSRHRYNAAGIVSDGTFSARGAVADVGRIVDLGARFRCVSVIDDTHGIGASGRGGRGVIDLFDAKPDVVTGGFSKAFGAFGGFVVASRNLATVIDHFGRQNINTSHLSPVTAAQSLINLRYYRRHMGELSAELNLKLRYFNRALSRYSISCYPTPDLHIHPIFCFYKKVELDTLDCLQRLMREGFLPSFFPYPVCPDPTLRFSLHRTVPVADLERLVGLLGGMSLTPVIGRSHMGTSRGPVALNTSATPQPESNAPVASPKPT